MEGGESEEGEVHHFVEYGFDLGGVVPRVVGVVGEVVEEADEDGYLGEEDVEGGD